MLAGLACVALIFAGCNQAVDDVEGVNNSNYAELNDGNPVSAAYAADAILNQRGGTIKAKITNGGLNGEITTAAELQKIVDAMRTNSSVNVELDLSDIWIENVGSGTLKDAFGGIVVPNTAASDPSARKVTAVGEIKADTVMFTGLKNLVSINLPFTVGKIDANAFAGCENLERVIINFFFVTNVSKLNKNNDGYMFDDVFLLKEIGNNAFEGCAKLTDFVLVSDPDVCDLAKDDVDYGFPVSLQTIGDAAFKNCYSLKSVRFVNTRNGGKEISHGDITSKDDDYADSWFPDTDNINRNTLLNYKVVTDDNLIPAGYGYTDGTPHGTGDILAIKIGDAAFQNCTGISEIDFTNKKTVTGATYNGTDTLGTNAAISYCAFDGCEGLEKIYFGKKKDGKEAYDRADIYEYGGITLYETTIANPEFVKYGDYAFQRTALETPTVAALLHAKDYDAYGDNAAGTGTEADVVTYIGKRAFFGDEALDAVELPSTIIQKAAAGVGLGEGAFANTGVEYIYLHEDHEGFLSITPEFLAQSDGDLLAYTDTPELLKYWQGALIGGEGVTAKEGQAPDYDNNKFPGFIAFWKAMGDTDGNLAYLPAEESQNPRTKILGGKLTNIWADAFYKNVDVKAIMLPSSMAGAAPNGIGGTAFANAESLEYVGYEDEDGKPWAGTTGVQQGGAAFANVPAVEADLVITQTKGKLNK